MKLYVTPEGRWLASSSGLEHPGACRFDVPTSKTDLIEWLTFHCFNPHHPAVPQAEPVGVGDDPCYAVQTVLTDTAFQALPLGQRLNLAMLALEDAYQIVKAAGGAS